MKAYCKCHHTECENVSGKYFCPYCGRNLELSEVSLSLGSAYADEQKSTAENATISKSWARYAQYLLKYPELKKKDEYTRQLQACKTKSQEPKYKKALAMGLCFLVLFVVYCFLIADMDSDFLYFMFGVVIIGLIVCICICCKWCSLLLETAKLKIKLKKIENIPPFYESDEEEQHNAQITRKKRAWKNVKVIAIASLSVLVVVTTIVGTISYQNSPAGRVAKYDAVVNDLKSDVYFFKVEEDLEELGLGTKIVKHQMDREFFEEYLKTHTQEELFQSLDVVCEAIFDDTYDESARSMYLSKLRRIVYTAIDVAEIEVMNVDLSVKGAEGYYTEHADDYPLREERDKTGHFYNSSGENSRYDTKTCVTEYTYYGDFAIMHDYGYSYDKGEYGWVNGEFRDELPSWDQYDDYFLEYKGFHIDKQSHISEKEFLSYAQSLTYIVVGDTMYFLNIPQNYISGVWETHKK